jgi:hypothetical protein
MFVANERNVSFVAVNTGSWMLGLGRHAPIAHRFGQLQSSRKTQVTCV